jgi:hypothetical protein
MKLQGYFVRWTKRLPRASCQAALAIPRILTLDFICTRSDPEMTELAMTVPVQLSLAFALALAIMPTSNAAADERLPQKFIGSWCADLGSTEALATYQRERQCRNDQEAVIVEPHFITRSYEVACKVNEIEAATEPERYKVKFHCRFLDGQEWEDINWLAIERGRLIIAATNEDGSPKTWPLR